MNDPTHGRPLLADRVAVVTGGGGGIGAATSRLFAEHGARVVVADIDPDLAGRTVEEIGDPAFAVVTDVRDAGQVGALARTVLDRYGRADVLVNNVGHWLRRNHCRCPIRSGCPRTKRPSGRNGFRSDGWVYRKTRPG